MAKYCRFVLIVLKQHTNCKRIQLQIINSAIKFIKKTLGFRRTRNIKGCLVNSTQKRKKITGC